MPHWRSPRNVAFRFREKLFAKHDLSNFQRGSKGALSGRTQSGPALPATGGQRYRGEALLMRCVNAFYTRCLPAREMAGGERHANAAYRGS